MHKTIPYILGATTLLIPAIPNLHVFHELYRLAFGLTLAFFELIVTFDNSFYVEFPGLFAHIELKVDKHKKTFLSAAGCHLKDPIALRH